MLLWIRRSPPGGRRNALPWMAGWAALLMTGVSGSLAAAAAKPVLTVADAIQTTRFMTSPRGQEGASDGVFVSPDGKRYVVMLIRGDIERNGNWVEFLSGSLESYAQAREAPRSVARLFTHSLGSSTPEQGIPALTAPRRNAPTWLADNEHIRFFWPRGDVIQAATLNVSTGELTYLTNARQHVLSFDIGPDGRVLYSAIHDHSRERSEQLLREGFKVETTYLLDLLYGDVDGYGQLDRANNSEWFVSAGSGGQPPRRVSPNGEFDRSALQFFQPAFSPDGSHALIEHSPPQIPDGWSRYTERAFAVRMAAHLGDPESSHARFIRQMFVVDMTTGGMKPLWPAPSRVSAGTQAAWSADGRSVLVGPVFLPVEEGDNDPAALEGRAIAAVEVASGDYVQVELPAEHAADPIRELRWLSADRVEIVQPAFHLQFERRGDEWKLMEVWPVQLAAAAPAAAPAVAPVRMEWRQGLNTPPALYAVDAARKRSHRVFDPNPGLARFQLGEVEMVEWTDGRGQQWRGRLYHPAQKKGERVPLVIQTHAYASPDEFNLYGFGASGYGGPALGPGYSVFAAQPLAGRNIAVLQIGSAPDHAKVRASPQEAQAYMSGYESAVESLARRGLVDPARVGIVGFSRTGWHVLYALTHSEFKFAAAIVTDAFDGSYIQAAMLGWNAEIAMDNGGEPFGEGLKAWLENAPGFNIHRLQTPLRLQIESQGLPTVIALWEVYSRARYLKKPVEMYVIPNIARGSHGIQNPGQCLASQQGAVEWFDTLLNGPRS